MYTRCRNTEVPDKVINNALSYIRKQIKDDGSLKDSKKDIDIYSISVCLQTLTKLKKDEDKESIKKMRAYLIKSQSKLEAFSYNNVDYPDLSNTHWAIESIYISTTDRTNQDYLKFNHRAAKFISSCQIIKNKASKEFGGFTYYPRDKAPKVRKKDSPEAVFGSLTIGAVKSLFYTGVKADDERMKNAWKWIQNNYSITTNPGLDQGGYYYYLYNLTSTMLIWGKDRVDDIFGRKHNWRQTILETLLSKQKGPGNWINKNSLWREDNTSLCTAYAILSMEFCLIP